jgi:hypothetical protein
VNDGFWSVLVFPSPNVQFHVVGKSAEVSVNWTVSGTEPDTGVALKEAVGGTVPTEFTVTVWVKDAEPMEFAAVSVTV